jgi:nucleoprotein TPR
MRTRARAADPAAVDVAYLATTFDVPETDVQTLLDAPTADLVKSFLQSVAVKAHEYEELKAEKLKTDVELENTVRTSEAKVKAQKAQVTKHAKEVEELRTKLNDAESARENLASELEQLRSSTTGSTAETQALRQRIETLQASHRDALALVESRSSEKDRVANELSEQHSKLLNLRREISQLEERNQSLENAASSQKFKEQSLQQEIELLKKNNEWHSNELQTRTQEHAKFRKERNARIASLQRELEDANATVDTLRKSESSLRQRLDEVQAKADEAFARIAALEEEAARKEQDFKTELNSTKRLAELQRTQANTHKARLQEVQGQIDQIRDDAADEIGRLQAEVETERGDKEAAERRLAELEVEVERLEQQQHASRPGTPMRNGAVDPMTPARFGSRCGSPSALPGSLRKSVGGLSFTQLYAQYTEAQQELAQEQARNKKLSTAMDELVTQIESRAPEILDLKEAHDKLDRQVLEYSTMLDDANAVRDNAVKEAQHWQSEAAAAAREGDILRQQLRDLAAQIKILLVEAESRDRGLSEMSADERIELERAARGEIALENMTDTGRFIAERLVLFRDVSELQEKNQQMLRLVQTLGDKLEGEEAQEKERQTQEFRNENEALRSEIERLKRELSTTVTTIDSYMKERDMFRRMLQHRGQLPADGDLQTMFGQSVPPQTPSRNGQGGMEPPTPRARDVEDLNKLLKEQQKFFDDFRNESAEDRKMLKEQVDALAREKSTLDIELAKAKSQLTLADERYSMLQSTLERMRSENNELQKRGHELSEQITRQDLRVQQVVEELAESKSMTDSLRHENANVKAEKDLWKRIEARLTEDNKSLMDERSRLNKLVADLQNLQNERELADSETRRRLQSRTEALESELADTKKKLDHEVEENRKVGMRREYEENQSRTRIDDLVKSLGNVREELVAAKTTRDQLQARVEEMKIELRAAEEKVTALQPRPTPRPQAAAPEDEPQANGENDEELSAEQRLALEVSELRRDLELARNELEAARQQVEQYKSIAQTSEEELASLNLTCDQFKEDNDRLIAEKDARIKELEQRIEDLNSELMTTNMEVSNLRTQAEEASRALADQKATFDADMARFKDDAERHATEKSLLQQDLQAQAAIAQQAQQSYEEELVKHSEATKVLQSVRKEYNDLRTEVAGFKAETEAAKTRLERGEESWGEQKEGLEREVEEAKRRRADMEAQMKVLHQQLEAFSNELAALRQNRAQAPAEAQAEGEAGSPSRTSDANLQEVINFLRREKEILEVQYELSVQEAKRLQQQLDYANGQLEESRAKLAEERRKASSQEAAEGSTNKLLQTINELNLYRESATTLRNEARQAKEKLEEKSRELERMSAEIEPLKARVSELEAEIEAKDGEIRLLQHDRDHWRERTQNIISKYDRVDPAELEAIKSQLESKAADLEKLRTEKDALEAELQQERDGLDAKIEEATKNADAKLANFRQQAKARDTNRNELMTQLKAELESVKSEKEGLKAEVEKVKGELETARQESEALKQQLQAAESKLASSSGAEGEEGEVREDGTSADDHAALHAKIAEAEQSAAAHAARVEELNGRVSELEGHVNELEQQLAAATSEEAASGESTGANAEAFEQLRQELEAARTEVQTLRSANTTALQPAQPTSTAIDTSDADTANTIAQLQAQHALAMQQKEEQAKDKIDTMRKNLSKQLNEKKGVWQNEAKEELIKVHEAELTRLKEEHAKEIESLNEQHAKEIEQAKQQASGAGGNAISTTVEGVPGVSPDVPELSPEQVNELFQKNARARTILNNNITKRTNAATEKLQNEVKAKEEQIAALKAAATPSGTGDDVKGEGDDSQLQQQILELEAERDSLQSRISALEKEKEDQAAQAKKDLDKAVEAAKISALHQADLKMKLTVANRELFKTKLGVVETAAKETPEKPVKEVWDVVSQTKVAVKPAGAAGAGASTAAGTAASPAPAPAVTAAPAPAVTAAPAPAATTVAAPAQAQGPAQPLSEDEKLRRRAERFGTSGTTPATSSFGQPSAVPAAVPARSNSTTPVQGATPGTFGKPSAAAAAPPTSGQPSLKPALSVNPQAPSFTPGAAPAGPRGGMSTSIPRSGLPRGGGGARNASGSISFQGAAANAAANQNQGGQGQGGRGGGQSGLPRGGGRGGRGGGIPRGSLAGAGQKRPHDGADDGGDGGKRMRGQGGGSS